MDFITIDFETAGSGRDTPCEVGLTFVENRKITHTKSWLIKPNCWPDFNQFNINIHGITPEMVKDSPEWDELWPELVQLISGKFLIAHNAGFDISVLRNTLSLYNIEQPEFSYACSYIFSKHAWPLIGSYSLDSLCHNHGINREFHRAGEDSRATAELTIKAFEDFDINSPDDLKEKLKTIPGENRRDGYNSCLTKRISGSRIDASQIKGDPDKLKPESIFYGRSVVFTGTLSSMQRKEAFQKIVDIGGAISDKLNRETDYLVVGQQNFKVVGESGMSSKQKKALEYANQGIEIEVISEDFFLENLE